MFQKVYNYDTQQIEEAAWCGNKKQNFDRQCVAAGKPINAHTGRLSYQCAIPSKCEMDGKKYCWKHKEMIDLGKKVELFPPGPVK
jgi:hypothetical protein